MFFQGQFYDTYPANGDLDPSPSEYESLGNVLVLQSGDDLIADQFRFKRRRFNFQCKGNLICHKTVIYKSLEIIWQKGEKYAKYAIINSDL